MRRMAAVCTCAALLAVCGCQEQRARYLSRSKSKPASTVPAVHRSGEKFRGFDLSKTPRTTRTSDLPDLWEERPQGSGSFEVRKEAACVYSELDGAVYHIAEKNRFYIQHDPV